MRPEAVLFVQMDNHAGCRFGHFYKMAEKPEKLVVNEGKLKINRIE